MTREQLLAARMLLHLKQDTLAALSGVGVATIKRFETGSGIRAPQLASLRLALEKAGAILLDGGVAPEDPPLGVGVALWKDDLPEATQQRITADESREAERIEAGRRRLRERKTAPPSEPPKRGRPRTRPD